MTDLFQTPPKRQKRLIWSSSPSSGGSAPTSDERVVLRFQLPDVNNRAKRVDYSLTKSQFKDVTPDKSPKHAVWEEKFFRRIEIIGTCHLQIKSKYDICTAYSEGRTGIACSWAQKTDNSGSLVNLKSHLTSCHKSIVNGMTSPQKKAIFGEVKTQTKLGSDVALKIDDNFKMSPMAVKEAIGKHIILDMAPLSVSENRGFREMMADLRPDLKLPVRSTMTLYVKELFRNGREKVRNTLTTCDSQVCITLDVWTSADKKTAYLGVTAHYIHKFEIKACVLDIVPLSGNHSGANLAKKVKSILVENGIWNRFFTVTSDNASNNSTMVENLVAELVQQIEKESVDETQIKQEIHIRCWAHVVDLAVQDFLDVMRVENGSITKLHDFIVAVKDSPQRIEALQQAWVQTGHSEKEFLMLVLDVATRWYSTFDMIDRALLLRDAISKLMEEDAFQNFELTRKEWDELAVIQRFLGPVKATAVHLMGNNYITSSDVIPTYTLLFEHLDQFTKFCKASAFLPKYGETVQRRILLGLSRFDVKLQKYWSNASPFLSIATTLNPRYNIAYFLDRQLDELDKDSETMNLHESEKQRLAKEKFDNEFLNRARELWKAKYATVGEEVQHEPQLNESPDVGRGGLDRNYQQFMPVLGAPKRKRGSHLRGGSIKDELEEYLKVGQVENVDALKWWEANKAVYPRLWKMAVDFLAIPGSSVPSERLFSDAGNIISSKRNRLTPETAQALICTHNWYESGMVSFVTKEVSKVCLRQYGDIESRSRDS